MEEVTFQPTLEGQVGFGALEVWGEGRWGVFWEDSLFCQGMTAAEECDQGRGLRGKEIAVGWTHHLQTN
jgi:hypothetical protein